MVLPLCTRPVAQLACRSAQVLPMQLPAHVAISRSVHKLGICSKWHQKAKTFQGPSTVSVQEHQVEGRTEIAGGQGSRKQVGIPTRQPPVVPFTVCSNVRSMPLLQLADLPLDLFPSVPWNHHSTNPCLDRYIRCRGRTSPIELRLPTDPDPTPYRCSG